MHDRMGANFKHTFVTRGEFQTLAETLPNATTVLLNQVDEFSATLTEK